MNGAKKTYITTPIYYLNDKPHIGHFYTSLLADSLIRFKKEVEKKDVIFLTGTDEHGQKVQKSAQNKGIGCQMYCNEMSGFFKNLVSDFNLIFSENNFNNGKNFIRTTDLKHKKFVQKVWQRMIENNWVYLSKYEGYYAQRDEAFYEKNELIEGRAPTGADVEFRTEECYFFRLSYFRNIFLNCVSQFEDRKKLTYLPANKVNEITSFIKEELKDLPVSRLIKKDIEGNTTFDWGIPIPIINKNDENHVIYVWLDALFNYVSAIGIKNGILQEDKEISDEDFDLILQKFKNLESIHIIGKEILRFHGLYWPAFLFAVENKFEKPLEEENQQQKQQIYQNFIDSSFSQLIIHGWWTNEGQKISKSLGNIISPYEEIKWLQEEFQIEKEIAIDYFRFFLLCSFSCTKDCDYSRSALIDFVNSNLVNNIGNLINRSISLFKKSKLEKLSIEDKELYDLCCKKPIYLFESKEIQDNILISGEFFKNLIFKSSRCNELTEEIRPWELLKNNKNDKLSTYFYYINQEIKQIINLLKIFCPSISERFENIIASGEDKIITKRLEKKALHDFKKI